MGRAASSPSSRAFRPASRARLAGHLLKPSRVELDRGRAKAAVGDSIAQLAFTVTLAGGSRLECESWFIVLDRWKKRRTDVILTGIRR